MHRAMRIGTIISYAVSLRSNEGSSKMAIDSGCQQNKYVPCTHDLYDSSRHFLEVFLDYGHTPYIISSNIYFSYHAEDLSTPSFGTCFSSRGDGSFFRHRCF